MKSKDIPEPLRIFDHPDRPELQQAEDEKQLSDRAQIRKFFKRMGGGE